jgi:hypothetical protein
MKNISTVLCKIILTGFLPVFICLQLSAQNLGTASNFVLFTITGAVGNSGVSQVTGNIGTNNGAISGFEAADMTGNAYNADGVTAQCSSDLRAAYTELNNIVPTSTTHAPAFGSGETLFAGVYSIGAAGSVVGTLILDAQGNSDAIFIFKFGGAFTTGAASTIALINGASACNVFWLAEGQIAMGASTTMSGTLIANNGAISMADGGTLEGRMFSTTGAANIDGSSISIPTCASSIPATPGPISGSIAICTGSVQQYSVEAVSGATSYTWTLPGGWTGSSTTNSITVTAGSSGTISVTANNSSGSSAARSLPVTANAGVPLKPGSPTGQQFNLCSGGQFTYSVPFVTGVTYTWSTSGSHIHFVSVSTTNSVTVNIDAGINHEYLNVIANNSCGGSPVKDINLWGYPAKPIVTGPTCVVVNQQNVVFTVSNPEVGASYNWTVSGAIQIVSGQGTPILTVNWKKSNGSVAVIAGNSCTNAPLTRYLVTTDCSRFASGKIMSTEPVLRVYPNPATSVVQVIFTAKKETNYTIELSDLTGRVLQRKELKSGLGENRVPLDLSKYTYGTYVINVTGDEQRQTINVFKSK